MSDPLSVQIRASLCRYLVGEISLADFQGWFLPATWDMEGSEEPDAIDLAHEMHLRLAEFSNGDWTEEELKEKLKQNLMSITVHYGFVAGLRVHTGTSSVIMPSREEASWTAVDIQPVGASS